MTFNWQRKNARKPWVIAHRGARNAAPENTLKAFELAYGLGADGVELDVRLNQRGEAIVIHDRTLERVTQGQDIRSVECISTTELSRINVGAGENIPLLRDVLNQGREFHRKMNIELKNDVWSRRRLVQATVETLTQFPDLSEQILISSFDPRLLFALQSAWPHACVAWLCHSKQHILRRVAARYSLGTDGIHPEATFVTRHHIQKWKQRNLLVNVWTVNEPALARRLSDWGIDGTHYGRAKTNSSNPKLPLSLSTAGRCAQLNTRRELLAVSSCKLRADCERLLEPSKPSPVLNPAQPSAYVEALEHDIQDRWA